jgi:purine-binding chemotaxis protein CheW
VTRTTTATAAAAVDGVAADGRTFLTFQTAGQLFGLPLLDVHDVLDARPLTPVPLAPPEIVGTLNLRGRIITAVDLRRRLGVAPRQDGRPSLSLVVDDDDERYTLIVDTVGEVLTVPEDRREETPSTLDPRWQAVSAGVCRLDRALMVVLDVRAVLTLEP